MSNQSISLIKSPLNYIGGKYKLLPQILPLFPNDIHTFVDLFCGGCNVGINVCADNIIFNDNLTYMVDMYNSFLHSSTEDVVNYIENRISEYSLSLTNKEGYCKLRSNYNNTRNPLDLFVLISYSFNHQIRYNSSHQFTTPFGTERSCYNASIKSNLLSFLDRLHEGRFSFSAKNFDEYPISELGVNDFVYCDPPYLITTGSYNDGKRGFTGWGKNEELKLLDILTSLNQKGVRFALSNVFEHKGRKNSLLIEWCQREKLIVNFLNKDYSNSSYHTKFSESDRTIEVLITNYLVDSFKAI